MVTMRDDRTHPLLAQIPLTVSPFVFLPTAATLPYTYKAMPSTLPPPASGVTGATDDKVKYVVAASGHAAHPDDIVASCRALRAHIDRVQEESKRLLYDMHVAIRNRELAEKRRVAPGWLDSDERLLLPERSGSSSSGGGGPAAAAFRPAEEAEAVDRFAETSIADRDGAGAGSSVSGSGAGGKTAGISEMAVDQGEELDRAFGGLRVDG
ncbi:uncharacterized protein F4812DRAFT_421250 [Daldinia caldariorum]|uniref:uncharacterized protein n=1 Tax=Daldinia caldariorum TaxID=326644 RepID=UPI0020088A20|nr:uncharacterized protein F4812DRAFT_421250 [Daldinia caldariorum]KAI1470029.1 hypothetical protein F4812DRAFT_421250 [Daldinia caldariorum]